jgi:hypothetical protein
MWPPDAQLQQSAFDSEARSKPKPRSGVSLFELLEIIVHSMY